MSKVSRINGNFSVETVTLSLYVQNNLEYNLAASLKGTINKIMLYILKWKSLMWLKPSFQANLFKLNSKYIYEVIRSKL